MAKTIVFKKEFEDKLKELKIKTEFSRELLDYWKRRFMPYESRIICLSNMNRNLGFKGFINSAFTWMDTKSGFDYWSTISKK